MRVFTRRKVFLPLLAALIALGITAAVALANVTLASHTGEVGATWTKHTNYSTAALEVNTTDGALRGSTASTTSLYYASGSPTNANYKVEADIKRKSAETGSHAEVVGRVNTAAQTFYDCTYTEAGATWYLQKKVAGTNTILDSTAMTLTNGQAYHVELSMNGTTITCKVDGVTKGTATDSSITAAGKAGLAIHPGSSPSDSTGFQIDNFTATDL